MNIVGIIPMLIGVILLVFHQSATDPAQNSYRFFLSPEGARVLNAIHIAFGIILVCVGVLSLMNILPHVGR